MCSENNRLGLRFHHLGLAVRKPEKAVQMLAMMNYKIGETVYDPLQQVNLIFCTADSQPDVEIIYPESSPSPIDTILETSGELIYHICYTTDDLHETLEGLKAGGIRLLPLALPKPAILFGKRKVSFYRAVGFGTIELLELQ